MVETSCRSSFFTMKLDKTTSTVLIYMQRIVITMRLIQATIILLLTGMFCSAFPQCSWPRSTLTSCRECYHFTEKIEELSVFECSQWKRQSTGWNKHLSTHFIQQPTSTAMEMYSICLPKFSNISIALFSIQLLTFHYPCSLPPTQTVCHAQFVH